MAADDLCLYFDGGTSTSLERFPISLPARRALVP